MTKNLTGTRKGSFSADTWRKNEQYFITLELVQIDRTVYGQLAIFNAKEDVKPQVVYLLSGELSFKKGKSFHLYREAILDTEYDRSMAEYFNDLEVSIKPGDSTARQLSCYWFPNINNGPYANGAAGKYAVVKTTEAISSKEMKTWLRAKKIEESMQ